MLYERNICHTYGSIPPFVIILQIALAQCALDLPARIQQVVFVQFVDNFRRRQQLDVFVLVVAIPAHLLVVYEITVEFQK